MAALWRIAPDRFIKLDRPRVMAIINATPDSFSDGAGSEHAILHSALDRAERALEEGADLLDIGGESARPGAAAIPPKTQIARVVPVIRELKRQDVALPVSIDTTSAEVAAAAIDEGAQVINDISAGLDDPAMLPLAAAHRTGLVLMHRLRKPAVEQYSHDYLVAPAYPAERGGVVGEIKAFLNSRTNAALHVGINRSAIVVDPGLGFGKNVEQNFELSARIAEFAELGFAVLSAASRKSFLGSASGVQDSRERVSASVAVSVLHFIAGIRLFRVHDVSAHVQALRVAARIAAGDRAP